MSRSDPFCRYYRLGVWYTPLSKTKDLQQQFLAKRYIAAQFSGDRLPNDFILGEDETTADEFNNKPLEPAYAYYLVFYSHVGEVYYVTVSAHEVLS